MDYLSRIIKAAVWDETPPNEPEWNTWIHRNLSDNHCDDCLKLNDCWFVKESTPPWPHHPFCHCVLERIPYSEVLSKTTATAFYSKFDPYLFDPDNFYKHGKSAMLESWGYSVHDSAYLKEEIEKQGLEKYRNGEYTLGVLNVYGQRIRIRVELPRKNGDGTISFITGWMVMANGRIQLNTPFGGK